MVKNITDYGAFIDLDGLDGLLHITDMSWGRVSHPSEMVKTGEEITVSIIDVDYDRDRVSLGLKQLTPNPWDGIERKFPLQSKVRGKVVNLVPYGAFIELEAGVEGLVHVTEMSWTKRITKPGDVLNVGDEVDAVVLGIQQDDQKISLGLRQLDANPWPVSRKTVVPHDRSEDATLQRPQRLARARPEDNPYPYSDNDLGRKIGLISGQFQDHAKAATHEIYGRYNR